jgi:hypothetical protein
MSGGKISRGKRGRGRCGKRDTERRWSRGIRTSKGIVKI